MPGFPTTAVWRDTRADAFTHVALPSVKTNMSAPRLLKFSRLNGWSMRPCRRFAVILTDASARPEADADRCSFTVVDFRVLLPAGFTGAPKFLDFAT